MTHHHHHHRHHCEHHVAQELVGLYRHIAHAEALLQEWHDTGHHPTKGELCNVQKELSKVDEHYEEGAFKVDGQVHEGQAILATKLNHAHCLLRDFEVELEE